jgi:hypothetical protein
VNCVFIIKKLILFINLKVFFSGQCLLILEEIMAVPGFQAKGRA